MDRGATRRPSRSRPKRTLIVHSGGIGDFICALPALQQLAQEGPLEVAGIPERAALAQAAGIATAVHRLDAIDFSSVFSTPSRRLADFLTPFDRIRIWMADEDGTITKNLRALGIDDVRCFQGIPPADWEKSAAQYYAQCAGTPVNLPFVLPITPSISSHDVIIQPGSGSAKKNWDLTHYETVARTLEDQGRHVAWCFGPAEDAIAHPPNTVSQVPLVELAALLTNTRLFIGNDSGIGHLASVVGCPGIAIFGPTNPAVWWPIGPHTRVVQGNPWPSVDAVIDLVDGLGSH